MQRSFFLPLAVFLALAPRPAVADGQRPLAISDMLAWKRIQSPSVSPNGEWFAYRLAPAEGNAEVVIRNLNSGKELRFPIGDPGAAAPAPAATPGPTAAPAAAGGADLSISFDSRWAAFHSYPTTEQAKRLKKDRKPIQTKVVLVELAAGKKTEFEKVRRFAFSGEGSTYLALQRYGPDAPPQPAAPAAAAAAVGAGPAPDRPTGADLLLYELATGNELNAGNVAEFSFDKKGAFLAYAIDAQDKAGNGIELRNMST